MIYVEQNKGPYITICYKNNDGAWESWICLEFTLKSITVVFKDWRNLQYILTHFHTFYVCVHFRVYADDFNFRNEYINNRRNQTAVAVLHIVMTSSSPRDIYFLL